MTPRLVEGRVAVATLENRTGDPRLEGLAALATDWIAQGLQRTGHVSVVPPVTVRQAEGWLSDRAAAGAIPGPGAGVRPGDRGGADGARLSRRLGRQPGDPVGSERRAARKPSHGPGSHPGSRDRAEALVAEARSRIMSAMAAEADPAVPSVGPIRPDYDAYRRFDEGFACTRQRAIRGCAARVPGGGALDTSFVEADPLRSPGRLEPGGVRTRGLPPAAGDGSPGDLTPWESAWVAIPPALVRATRRRHSAPSVGPRPRPPTPRRPTITAWRPWNRGATRRRWRRLKVLDADRGPMRGMVTYLPTAAAVQHLRATTGPSSGRLPGPRAIPRRPR